MTRLARSLVGLGLVVLLAGCYHATIETGLPPSAQTLENSFASGWIYGLVPPSTVETASRCPNGAAKVETQLSFVNQLVNFLTLGIYTPMSIKVTCAAAGSGGADGEPTDVMIDAGGTMDEKRQAFTDVVGLSLHTGKPIWVEIR